MQVVVVGGGIAGLAAAWGLARSGAVSNLVLLEREDQLFAHSSGRNAAIFRPIELQPAVSRLAVQSARLYDEVLGGRSGWLRPDGVLLTADDRERLVELARSADDAGVSTTWLDRDALLRKAPVLAGGQATIALFTELGGVLDVHAISMAFSRSVRDSGGRIELACPVRRVLTESGRVSGVELESGRLLPADCVVIAGGAWAAALGASCSAPIPLFPVRRHLVMLEPETPLPPETPTVWDARVEAYFRPESGAVLASPGDATPWPAELPPTDTAALELLSDKLARMAPSLAGSKVRRAWACLRTFAPDKVGVVGADPRLEGLFWLAGLGGHGICAGAAAGELLAHAVLERDHPELGALSPARFS